MERGASPTAMAPAQVIEGAAGQLEIIQSLLGIGTGAITGGLTGAIENLVESISDSVSNYGGLTGAPDRAFRPRGYLLWLKVRYESCDYCATQMSCENHVRPTRICQVEGLVGCNPMQVQVLFPALLQQKDLRQSDVSPFSLAQAEISDVSVTRWRFCRAVVSLVSGPIRDLQSTTAFVTGEGLGLAST